MVKKRSTPKSPTPEEFGVMVKNIYETGYLDRNTAYKMSFVKGVLGGLGGVLGATIVVALLMWFLSAFQDVPLVGRFVDTIRHTVQTEPK